MSSGGLINKLENVEDIYPLTPAQQGMLVHTIGEPRSGLYVQQIITRLSGEIAVDRLKLAWDRVLERHSALRSVFIWEGLDEPLQVVREEVDVEWEFFDWRAHSLETRTTREAALLSRDRQQGFDLTLAPLMRMYAIQVADDEWLWIWSVHHLLCDGWSVAILRHEMELLYGGEIDQAPVTLPPVIPFRDHLQRLSDRNLKLEDDFWSDQVDGFEEPTRLAVSRFREFDTQTERSKKDEAKQCQQELLLSPELTDRLMEFARQNGLTLSTVVQAAWALLINRCSGSNKIIYGVTVSGRSEALEESSAAVGAYINTLPVCLEIDGTESLSDWLRSLQRKLGRIQEFQQSSLSRIQRQSGIQGELFESLFVFENYPIMTKLNSSSAFQQRGTHFIEKSNYPLVMFAVPGKELLLILNHHETRYPATVAKCMLLSMNYLLSTFVQSPSRHLSDLSLYSGQDVASGQPCSTDLVLQSGLPFKSVVEWLVEQVSAKPTYAAVTLGKTTLSYEELNAMADRIAVRLSRIGVRRKGRVAIACHGCVETIASIFAVLKLGAAYIPIDPGAAE